MTMMTDLHTTYVPLPCPSCGVNAVFLTYLAEGWSEEHGDILYDAIDEHPHCESCTTAFGSMQEYRDALDQLVEYGLRYLEMCGS